MYSHNFIGRVLRVSQSLNPRSGISRQSQQAKALAEDFCYIPSRGLSSHKFNFIIIQHALAKSKWLFCKKSFPDLGTVPYFCIKRKLRVIAKRILREYWITHEDCEEQLKSWYQESSKAEWKNLHEVKAEYPSASILKDNRVVFNIKGNTYRLIVKFNFDYQMIWIRFIGTHAEYDKINANKI